MKKAIVNKLIWFLPFALIFTVMEVRADGLPGEYLVTERWRAFFSDISPVNNPSIIQEQSHPSLRGVVTLSGQDIATLYEIGLTLPLGLYHTLGLTVVGENGKPVENWIENDMGIILEGESSSHSNSHFMLSYATHLWRGLLFGANANFTYKSNFGLDPDFNLGLDVGLSYRLFLHQLFGAHTVGLTYKNIPLPEMGNLNRITLSPMLRVNYSMSFLRRALEFDVALNVKDFHANPDDFLGSRQAEWDLVAGWRVWPLKYIGLKGFLEFTGGRALDTWGVAAAFNIPHLNRGRDFEFTYQYHDENNINLSGTQSAYLKYDFGLHREELYARRQVRLLTMSPNELYNRAMHLYNRGNHWDAFLIFARIKTEHPEFHLNDLVTYHAGSSLEKLDMQDEAIKMYEKTRSNYSQSTIVPNANLGLMRIHYRQNNSSALRNYYVELNQPNVSDSLRAHGSYLMGQNFLSMDDPQRAVREFKLISPEHPDYIFASHSKAIALLLTGAPDSVIIQSLENSINSPTPTEIEREIANRSCLFAGYLFYENEEYSKAVTALRMVPDNSKYYEEALLGLGWTALKAQQWRDCIRTGQSLASQTEDPVIKSEAGLIKGYGYLMKQQYSNAVEVFERAYDKLAAYTLASADSVEKITQQYKQNRSDHLKLADQFVSIAQRGANVDRDYTEQLRTTHDELREEFTQFYRFTFHDNRANFFFRSYGSIFDELRFALAQAKRLSGSGAETRDMRRRRNEQDQIEEELEMLRRKMEELEEFND
ncbi:hypothetical protein QA601_12625 [Chitinispirillales bacterium ANBcel5]|uniref:tetratricopeptide repeat protein n=1 Tax=Cellulosispirillum alkaliphilum TaxID=3039283 RepID=UPI002A525D1C|nr:hypothetical protein [Chitinispirillales bacterium ANBcel5]